MKQVWLVGQFRKITSDGVERNLWDLQGIFSTKQKAENACIKKNYFYRAFNLDELLPDEVMPDDGKTIYPRSKE